MTKINVCFLPMKFLSHSWLAVRERVGLARWLEASYVVRFDFDLAADEVVENAVDFEIVGVAEAVFVAVVVSNTVGFVGVV